MKRSHDVRCGGSRTGKMDGQECRSRTQLGTAAYAIWLMASALLSIIDTLRCQGSHSWPLLRQRHLPPDRCSPHSGKKSIRFLIALILIWMERKKGRTCNFLAFSFTRVVFVKRESLWKLISLIRDIYL